MQALPHANVCLVRDHPAQCGMVLRRSTAPVGLARAAVARHLAQGGAALLRGVALHRLPSMYTLPPHPAVDHHHDAPFRL
jgi:hypothetical protein